jgi:hypothetical protein
VKILSHERKLSLRNLLLMPKISNYFLHNAMAIREVWDLMYNYLIPAVVVEKKESWSEYAENFKKLTQKIPATLIGVFGIDFSEA